jgi:hypothetical protein
MANEATSTNNASASVTAVTAPAAPAPEFKVPEGKRLIDEREFETFTRNTERLRGADEAVRKYREYGFESPEVAAKWSPLVKQKLDPEMLTRAFKADMNGDDDGKPAATSFDPAKLKTELLSEFKLEQARERHAEEESREDDVITTAVAEIFKDADESDREDIAGIIRGRLYHPDPKINGRELYPQNHPLRDAAYRPVSDKLARSVVEAVKKARDERKAAALVAKGDKARKVTQPVPGKTFAGANTGNGAPERTTRTSDRASLREQAEAVLQSRIAQRGG